MSDRLFVDTNILVYSSLQDELTKHDRAVSFITSLKGNNIFVSTQVLSEFYVALLKHGVDDAHIVKILSEITDVFNVTAITLDTVASAWKLKKRHQFSYWDSLIIASAFETGCTILFTEDMQHGQMLGNKNKLKIINPIT